MWSVGCIFAELVGGKALFPGKDYFHQLCLIMDVLGTPAEEEFDKVGNFKVAAAVLPPPRAHASTD